MQLFGLRRFRTVEVFVRTFFPSDRVMKKQATVAVENIDSDSSKDGFSAVWLKAGPRGRRLLPAGWSITPRCQVVQVPNDTKVRVASCGCCLVQPLRLQGGHRSGDYDEFGVSRSLTATSRSGTC